MAGSMRAYDYVTDGGTTYGMLQDKTNGDAIGNTPTGNNVFRNGIPRNIKPRTAIYKWTSSGVLGQGTGTSVRRIVVGAKAAFDALVVGTDTLSLPEYQAVAGVGQLTPNVMRDFLLTDKIAERAKRSPVGGDTGETEG